MKWKKLLGEELGCGLTSRVILIERDDVLCAEKTIRCEDMEQLEMVRKEIAIQKMVDDHENVASVISFHVNMPLSVIVMEYAGSRTLVEYICSHRKNSSDEVVLLELLGALCHLHRLRIAHLDIKADNVVLSDHMEGPRIKLVDFGMSEHGDDALDISNPRGTIKYCAPEVIAEGVYNGFSADVWSFGIVVVCISYGCLAFHAPRPDCDVFVFFDQLQRDSGALASEALRRCYEDSDDRSFETSLSPLKMLMLDSCLHVQTERRSSVHETMSRCEALQMLT